MSDELTAAPIPWAPALPWHRSGGIESEVESGKKVKREEGVF